MGTQQDVHNRYRSLLVQEVCHHLTKDEALLINKNFRKTHRNSIFLTKPGLKVKPDSYDWRRDSDFIRTISQQKQSTILKSIINTLIEDSFYKWGDINDFYRNATEKSFLAPFILTLMAVCDEENFSKLHQKIKDIRSCCLKNRTEFQPHVFSDQTYLELLDPTALSEEELKAKFQTVYTETSDDNYEDNQSSEKIENGEAMNSTKYLGYIRLQRSFYNFYPVARIVGNRIEEMSIDEIRSDFPSHGGFCLVKDYFKDNATRNLIDNYFYIIELQNGDLVEYVDNDGEVRSDYRFKLNDFRELFKSGRFTSIENQNAYFIVYPRDENFNIESSIFVNFDSSGQNDLASDYHQRFPVVLAHDGKFIGPLTLSQNANNSLYVNLRVGVNDGILDCFEGEHIREAITHRSIFLHDAPDGATWCPRDILFTKNSSVYSSKIDVLSDEALLQRMAEQSKQFDKKTLPLVLSWLENTSVNSDLMGSDPKIKQARQERLASILNSLKGNKENIDTFATVVTNSMAMAKDDQSGFFDELCKRIIKDEEALDKIKEFKVIKGQLEVLEEEKERAEESLDALRQSIKDLTEEKENQQKQELEDKLVDINEKIEQAEQKLEEKLDGLRTCETLEKARYEIEQIKSEYDRAFTAHSFLSQQTKELESKLRATVSDKSVRELAFNPAIAHKFSEAAALWITQNRQNELLEKESKLAAITRSSLTGRELVDYLCEQTCRYRDYDRNTILNLYICLALNFLTVFSGKPGSGKTSICNIMAHVLGLNTINRLAKTSYDLNRFLPVSVERGWTSKRDFLGYYNPLSKVFETQDQRRYACFQMLDYEAKNHEEHLPFLILLDEANLSQMEYYWADFMNICDDRNEMSSISLGDGQLYRIPETLRFVATINNDQTTESLSPRLIDRSWIVTLPEPTWENFNRVKNTTPDINDNSVEIIDWNNLQATFSYEHCQADVQKYEDKCSTILDSIYKQFRQLGYSVSPRTMRSIFDYVTVATKWFENGDSQTFTYHVAIDYAVAQKLLPCISLVGIQHSEKLQELLNVFEKNDLTLSTSLLSEIIDRGENAMNMYSFF